MLDRLEFVRTRAIDKNGMDALPRDAEDSLRGVLKSIYARAGNNAGLDPIDDSDPASSVMRKKIARHAHKSAKGR
jgi:hypothetical protein